MLRLYRLDHELSALVSAGNSLTILLSKYVKFEFVSRLIFNLTISGTLRSTLSLILVDALHAVAILLICHSGTYLVAILVFLESLLLAIGCDSDA